MSRFIRLVLVGLTIAAPTLMAQEPQLEVKTFTLRNLNPEDAAKLVAPYVHPMNGGGVFDVGGMRAITVRETATNMRRIESLLREHDRARATLVLRFQLIAALDSARRDPAIAGIDSALRGLFRFAGYQLLAEGRATAEEYQDFSLTMAANQNRFEINGAIAGVDTTGGTRSVRISIHLIDRGDARLLDPKMHINLFSTGLTMPLGQSVVLGSAASGIRNPALILVVQPELAPNQRR